MTSQRQQRQDRYDHVLPFIQEVADAHYGGNLDRGFRHWAFATIFAVGHEIGDNDIFDCTAIDGSDDFEIDGYFIPESDDDPVVHLFQSKHRQPNTTMGPGELAKFLQAPSRILSATEVAASRNEETKALYERLMEKLKDRSAPCSINLVWATSGTLSGAARRNAEQNSSRAMIFEINGTSVEVPVSLECLDLDDLYAHHATQQESDDRTTKCDFVFQLEPDTYHQTQTDAEYRTLYMTVPVEQIISVFATHNYKIFRENPRGPLGNKVNTSIKRTLLDETERRRFHLLNNGITAICYSWRLDGNRLIVQDFQIINGCQTTVTLWNARAVLRPDPNVLITVKLTECPYHFAGTIAKTTNSQAALRAEDFISNDPVQIRLQREFNELRPPWFYQIKRGEWSKILGRTDRESYRQGPRIFRQISSKDVAQAVVAFAGFPGEAKDKIRDFLNNLPVSSLARESELQYEKMYTDSLSAVQLLLPSVIQRWVHHQVTEDKEDYPGLEYARLHIIWLIGEILKEHYNINTNLFPVNRAEAITAHIEEWFKPIYDIALIAINDALRSLQENDQFTGYRELFRTATNYRLIQSNLRNALRLSANFGNPMANLPA